MINIEQLPIPDWGLRCPQCDTPLAGMRMHRCSNCGQEFNTRVLLGMHRPIPDIGLTCPECDYILTGLPGNRCPECGNVFLVHDMLEEQTVLGLTSSLDEPSDHHLKKREPTFSGEERPLPDFGLSCAACNYSLAGTIDDKCPGCGDSFDLKALVPECDWVNIKRYIPKQLGMLNKTILYDAEIPYLVGNAGLRTAYGFDISVSRDRILIPRIFFWDALYTINQANQRMSSKSETEWLCPYCNEAVPGDFDVCWNCNTQHAQE